METSGTNKRSSEIQFDTDNCYEIICRWLFLSSSSLERFESCNLMVGANFPTGGASSHGEHSPLLQFLLLDTLSMGDQKFTRQVGLRRVINATLGNVNAKLYVDSRCVYF